MLAFGYTLVPPLVGALIVWALRGYGWWAMLVFVGLLVAAFVLPPVGDTAGGSALAIPVALLIGAGGAALYARVAGVRSFISVLAVAPAVVLLLFLVVSPVRTLVFPSGAEAVAGPRQSNVPIVHVVFDELPLSTLVDADGHLEAKLFPNFARLQRTSTWYRNATTVNDLTAAAVPAQLTGEQPGQNELPTVRDHPRNLFTLFEHSHRMTVVEPITALCPQRLCHATRESTLDRLQSLEDDLSLVVKHQLLPDDLRKNLPAVDRVWEGFEDDNDELQSGKNLRRDVLARLARDDPTAGVQRAIAGLESGAKPPLLFVHSTLPHGAWRYLPDGSTYDIDHHGYPGLGKDRWTGPQWQVDQAFARHVLQAQYADRLLGRLLDALQSSRTFDRAVVVVTADHGASFTTGQPRRPANDANVGAIAPIPFFVKYPGEQRAEISQRAVRTIDVLPTIAKAAGVKVPWKTDGMPAEERPIDPSAPIDVSHMGVHVLTEPLESVEAKRQAREKVEDRLLRDGVYAVGPRPDLIGRPRSSGEPVSGGPFVSGDVDVPDGTDLAVAVDGRIVATTRAIGGEFTAILPSRGAVTVAPVR